MDTTALIFTAIMPLFLVIGTGYFCRRFGWLNEEADRSLMKVVVNCLYPLFIFSYILGNDALREPSNFILPPLFGFTSVVVGFGACLLIAQKLKIGDQRACRTFAFTTGLTNYGYFPVPIIALLFDRETTGVLLVHNVGVEIAMWSLGVGFILSANDPKPAWRRILSPPVISILIAVPLNLLRIDSYLPNFIFTAISMLGNCAIPFGLLLIGATFADLAKGSKLMEKIRIPVAAISLRMLLFPIILLSFAYLLPLSVELKQVVMVQAAMPCAVFPIVLARHFNGSPEVALKVVLSTTLLSLVTIPLWLTYGMSLFNF